MVIVHNSTITTVTHIDIIIQIVPCIIEAIEKNPREEGMLREACFCIRNLALPSTNKMLICQQGALQAILVVLKTHEKNRDIVGAAVAAIRELTINAEASVIVASNNGAKCVL